MHCIVFRVRDAFLPFSSPISFVFRPAAITISSLDSLPEPSSPGKSTALDSGFLKPLFFPSEFSNYYPHPFLFLSYLSPKFTNLKMLIAYFYLSLELKGCIRFFLTLSNFQDLADSQKCNAASHCCFGLSQLEKKGAL